jgi:type I restriction enzyme, S subunit
MTPALSAKPMKNSGIAWAGALPSHWDVKRAKFLFSLAQREPGREDGIVTAFRDGQVTLRSNRRIDGFTNAVKETGYQSVRKGDLVIHAMDAFAGAIGVSDSDGKCTPVYSCCIPLTGASSDFYARCVRTMATTGYIGSLAKGIRERSTDFRWATFAEQFLPVPPRPEQDAIVAYLDRSTTRIDALAAKKARFIELLREKRQALITHVVTKGLDADVPMKDSGVEWLGFIPTHWQIVPPGALFTDSKERAHLDDQILSATQKYGVIPLAEFEALEQRQVTKGSMNFEMRKHVEVGDFVISMRSMDGGLERSHATGSVRSSYSVLKAHSHVDGRYFSLLLKCSMFIQALRLTSNFIRDGQDLSFNHVKKVKLPLPDLDEQARIAEFVRGVTTRIDTLISKTERSIELLREHRTALITAAVTGKIDLRSAA